MKPRRAAGRARPTPGRAPRFEDAASARRALARLGRRLDGVEPATAFRPGGPRGKRAR